MSKGCIAGIIIAGLAWGTCGSARTAAFPQAAANGPAVTATIATIDGSRVVLIPENDKTRQVVVNVRDATGLKAGERVQVRDGMLVRAQDGKVLTPLQDRKGYTPIQLPNAPDGIKPPPGPPAAPGRDQKAYTPITIPNAPDGAKPRPGPPTAPGQDEKAYTPIQIPDAVEGVAPRPGPPAAPGQDQKGYTPIQIPNAPDGAKPAPGPPAAPGQDEKGFMPIPLPNTPDGAKSRPGAPAAPGQDEKAFIPIPLPNVANAAKRPELTEGEKVRALPPGGGTLTFGFSTKTGTNLPGMDYRNFDLPAPGASFCEEACRKDPACRAFTYVKPGFQRRNARCWLKSGVPAAAPSECCVSGIRTK
jgi:hypothetical protein